MANKKFTDLPTVNPEDLTATDIIPLVNGGNTKTVVAGALQTYDARKSLIEWRKPISGNNFTSGAEVLLLDTRGDGVAKVNITSGGSGYGSAPNVIFTGGGGTGATAKAEISGGVVVQITVTNAGTGYTSAPAVSFSAGSATATATLGTTGPGNIERIQIALSTTSDMVAWNSTVNIYLNGSGSPTIQIRLGDFFFYRFMNTFWSSPSRIISAERVNITVSTGTATAGDRRIFIPFGTSVKVTLTNYVFGTVVGGNDSQLFSQVEYKLGTIPAWRGGPGTRRAVLRQTSWNAALTGSGGGADGYNNVSALATNNLANIASVKGEVESVMLACLNTSNGKAFMEGHIAMYADGGLKAEVGGTEDYFFNQFYGTNHICHNRGGMPSSDTVNTSWYVTTGYRLYGDPDNQFLFDNSFQITWQNGLPSLNSGSTFALGSVLYYTDS